MKRNAYGTAGVPIDATLKTAKNWSTKEIDLRTNALGKLAYGKVFRV